MMSSLPSRALLALAAALFSLATVAVAPAPAAAQAYDDSYQTWTSATVQGEITPDLLLYADLAWRFWDDFSPYQQIYRPAVAYRLVPGMHAWLGYGWMPSWNRNGGFTDEHRIWEQWSFDVPDLPDGMRLLVRARLEQRFRPELSSDVALRLRVLSRVLVPFARDFPLHLSLWDEAFVALSDAGLSADGSLWQRAGFDQNRLFVGIGWNAATGVRLEAGYLNHWIVRPVQDEVHHVAALNAFLTFR